MPEPSHLYSGNTAFIEKIYERYLDNPASVAAEWREYFDNLKQEGPEADITSGTPGETPQQAPKDSNGPAPALPRTDAVNTDNKKQALALQLINAHRFRGHQQADLDPLKQDVRPEVPELDPDYYHFTDEDMGRNIQHGFAVCAQ